MLIFVCSLFETPRQALRCRFFQIYITSWWVRWTKLSQRNAAIQMWLLIWLSLLSIQIDVAANATKISKHSNRCRSNPKKITPQINRCRQYPHSPLTNKRCKMCPLLFEHGRTITIKQKMSLLFYSWIKNNLFLNQKQLPWIELFYRTQIMWKN